MDNGVVGFRHLGRPRRLSVAARRRRLSAALLIIARGEAPAPVISVTKRKSRCSVIDVNLVRLLYWGWQKASVPVSTLVAGYDLT